ncbi:MAG: hypothetical protein M1839_001246 [Geoglossum umbratile]|nr:MAG: hypothetical protein M1839_001246 [Geoglossum umbratile]
MLNDILMMLSLNRKKKPDKPQPNVLRRKTDDPSAPKSEPPATPVKVSNPLPICNPYAGYGSAYQFSEPVPAFLSRLPPSTSTSEEWGPWIYIANPHSSYGDHFLSRKDLASFTAAGLKLLTSFSTNKASSSANTANSSSANTASSFSTNRSNSSSVSQASSTSTNNSNSFPSNNTQAVAIERGVLEGFILTIAKETNCTSGKWMLFPTKDSVDDMWAKVATATAEGQLGTAAKVSTADGKDNDTLGTFLICIYTSDFTDKADVKRVLTKMVSLGLAGKNGRPVSYKCGE